MSCCLLCWTENRTGGCFSFVASIYKSWAFILLRHSTYVLVTYSTPFLVFHKWKWLFLYVFICVFFVFFYFLFGYFILKKQATSKLNCTICWWTLCSLLAHCILYNNTPFFILFYPDFGQIWCLFYVFLFQISLLLFGIVLIVFCFALPTV